MGDTTESFEITALTDLRERLLRAVREMDGLLRLAEKVQDNDADLWRLRGKRQGVSLAIDYLRAYE